jgi:hypothetical protein
MDLYKASRQNYYMVLLFFKEILVLVLFLVTAGSHQTPCRLSNGSTGYHSLVHSSTVKIILLEILPEWRLNISYIIINDTVLLMKISIFECFDN